MDLQKKARTLIPGGTQLLSKRPEMFAPGQWPGYYSKAKGVEVWDVDGRTFIDMSICGIGANVLGYCDDDVDAAVRAAIDAGTSCSLNCPEEIELAELFCDIHPWAEMVRYSRTGGEAMSIAVRIARAFNGRDKIAFCGYHGWHDWYLAANLGQGSELDGHLLPGLEPAGVPRGLAGTALPFRYNHFEDLKAISEKHRTDLAAIIMEPIRDCPPANDFLKKVADLAAEIGAILIFDEITAAMRMNSGGAHLLYGIRPDIAVFAKAISNGFPMSAIIGTEKVMQAAQKTFISSTYWTERIGPVAAIATIRKHRDLNVSRHLVQIGNRVQNCWLSAAEENNLKITVGGIPPLSHFHFDYSNGQAMLTLFTQLMLERGFLASGRFYASFAHQNIHVEKYDQAVKESFRIIACANSQDRIEELLKGPIAHGGFFRLN